MSRNPEQHAAEQIGQAVSQKNAKNRQQKILQKIPSQNLFKEQTDKCAADDHENGVGAEGISTGYINAETRNDACCHAEVHTLIHADADSRRN